MLDVVAIVFLAICLFGVAYAYFLYPLIVWLLSRRAPPAAPPSVESNELPRISLLIAAHNEESVIQERIQNALALDYPPDRMEIVIASDGSDDRTVELVRACADERVRLVEFAQRQGKSNVLNRTIPNMTGEIVLLSDANTFYDPMAARRLVRWFNDPNVGAVCGRLVLVDPKTGTNVDSLYWRFETFLKRCEGRLGGLLGANGAVYAIRRAMYHPIPSGTLVDDFVIPLFAKIQTNCRIVYDSEAVAREETPPNIRAEFRRRARIGAGAYQSLAILRGILKPRFGWTAFTFISHKVMRWLCPFFLIGLLASNLFLLEHPLFRWLLGMQVGFYSIAILGVYLPSRFTLLKPLRLATMFVGMNLALLVGFCQLLFGKQTGTWIRTVRLGESSSTVGESGLPYTTTN